MSVRNLLCQILLISMFTQKFIKIFHPVQEITPFSLFQNLAHGKASTDDKCHFAILWARSFQHLFNIKFSAKFYQNIPNDLRVKFHFLSEFEPRQNLDRSQKSIVNLMGYILSIPMCMQNFITIFHSVQEIRTVPLFQILELGKTSSDEK